MSLVTFAATLLALKFAESTRGLEFDGWDDVLWTAVICWMGLGLPGFLLFAVADTEALPSLMQSQWLHIGIEFIASLILVLIAGAVVRGTHIRNAYGVIVASALIVGFNFGATLLMGSTDVGFWF